MLARLDALESGNVAMEAQLLDDDDDDETSIDDEQHMQLNFQLDAIGVLSLGLSYCVVSVLSSNKASY
ncbi:hypothetical protein H5410_025566 [Solanum commersonii]|uniref:Uncharacterized protein n=1 Tax=Solanum commersonii TaxID=4109 RepID=A0A9J5YUK2_SOLCO|nr:hypothetical protein H5410_025566 [Solanum commersonii]